MKQLVSYTILFLLFITVGISQDSHVFNAIIVDGNVLAKNGNESLTLRANSKIYNHFSIVISNNSYLALIHQTGRTLELQTAGTYKVSDLSKMINEQLGDYTNKYKNFLFEDNDKRSDYSKYAAINRPSERINILAPKNTKIIPSKSFSIHWSSTIPEGKIYKVNIEDIMGNKMISEETADTSLVIDLSKQPKTAFYKVSITCESHESETSLLAYNETAKVKKELEIASTAYDEQKAIDCVIIAKYYERHHLLLHSQYYLEKAISISNSDGYKKYYETFLNNYNIK